MNVYVAGPMRGYPHFNFPMFHKATTVLRSQGYAVFSPAEQDIVANGGADPSVGNETGDAEQAKEEHGLTARDCFLRDTEYICKHADIIALLPGWERSKGATAEKALGDALGLMILYLDENGGLVDAGVAA